MVLHFEEATLVIDQSDVKTLFHDHALGRSHLGAAGGSSYHTQAATVWSPSWIFSNVRLFRTLT
jgi:hypothetical protein